MRSKSTTKMELQFLFKLSLPFLLLSPIVSGISPTEIMTLCVNLPNPQQCALAISNHITTNPSSTSNNKDFNLLNVLIEGALRYANDAFVHTNTLGTKCRNELEEMAWSDCVKLYNHTVKKLDDALTRKCSQGDLQTWLSTSLTNLVTCQNGFKELGVEDYVFPLMSNNLTQFISNGLALNYVPHNEPSYHEGFPTWVNPHDRKLLQAPVLTHWWPSIAEPPASLSPSPSPAPAPAPSPEMVIPNAIVEAPMPFIKSDVVVAQDGSGDYKTLTEGVAAASSRNGRGRFVIYVKAGVYRENVEIEEDNVMLVGDGIGKTIITGSKSVGGGTTTFRSATVAVVGEAFMARGITFRNTAGPQNHQAVALRSGSDLSFFYQCSFEGYQDTLYVHSERQFYKYCDIYGTVDFIFGNAAVVFQNCNLYPRLPPNGTNTVTAQARTTPHENTGIIIHDCVVTASPELKPVQSTVKTYLGRPWQEYARVVYMKTFLDSLINPAGWMEWDGNFALNTLYYAEYANTGPGSSTANRVTWKGYHVLTSPTEVQGFTVANFIMGSSWLPATGVPFTPGL